MLHIDVLVQGAVFGPMGAENWTALTDDPDALGRDLLSSGRRTSGERNGEDYMFTPLPVGLTAVEIIAACDFYQYNRSKVPTIVKKLRNAAIFHIDGWAEAPWGWQNVDVDQRLDRPAPGSELPAAPPPEVTAAAEMLIEAGFTISSMRGTVPDFIDLQVRGSGKFVGSAIGSIRTHGGSFSPVIAYIAKTTEAAERAFPALVGRVAWGDSNLYEVRRMGRVLIAAGIDGPAERVLLPALDLLGVPDERWSSREPASVSGPGEVMGRDVRMELQEAALAMSPSDLEQLLSLLPEPDIRARLAEVDLRHHSVLAAPGLHPDQVLSVELARSARFIAHDVYEMVDDLFLSIVERATQPIRGSIVLVPKLKRRPNVVRTYTNETIPYAQRFTSRWWKPTTSLRGKKPRPKPA